MSIVRPKFFWPLVITSANKGIRVNNGTSDATVNIAEGTYVSAEVFRAAVETAIASHVTGATVYWSVQRNSDTDRSGKLVVLAPGAFSLLAGHAAFTSYLLLGLFAITYNAGSNSVYGYANGTASTVSGSFVVIGPSQHQNGWYPVYPPKEDSLPIREREMNVTTRSVGGLTKTLTEVELNERTWVFHFLEAWKVYQDSEGSTHQYEAFERLWAGGYDKFRYFPSEVAENSPLDYALTSEMNKRWAPERQFEKRALYTFVLNAWRYVS